MKSTLAILGTVFTCSTAFAGYGGQTLSCQSKDKSITAMVAVTTTGNFGETKGFEKKGDTESSGANNKISKPLIASILKDDKSGTISATAVRKDGLIIQILASGMKQEFCSGCTEGFRRRYAVASALSTGDYGYIQKNDLECELEVE